MQMQERVPPVWPQAGKVKLHNTVHQQALQVMFILT